MGDQHGLKVAAAATSQTTAMQKVCLLAFSHLLLHGPKKVLLRENHWTVPVATIQADAKAIFGEQSPASGSDVNLAPAPPPRSRKAQLHYEAPLAGEETQREIQICNILCQMIRKSETGWVNPSHTTNWQLLQRYVPSGSLKTFIREHEEFQIFQGEQNTWMFGFNQNNGPACDDHR
jgi:hypothetical protein